MKLRNFLTSALLATTVLLSSIAAAGEPVTNGQFTHAFKSWGSKSLSGSWSIVKDGDQLLLKLADNFVAKKAPDIKVFLSPKTAGDITGKNATSGSLFVQQIETFKGAMVIKLPAGTDLSQYKTLVIHCEEYSKLWGTSPL